MKQQVIEKANGRDFKARLSVGPLLQRKCACGQHTIGGAECDACRDKHNPLQRHSINQSGPSIAPDVVHEVLQSPGQPLDTTTRTFMESRFGHDFSQVRVHTDAKAAESAQTVNALAYTVGHDVVFGAGHYQPITGEGQRLLAHELTHVVQQQSGFPLQRSLTIGYASDPAEREADAVAATISDHQSPVISSQRTSVLVQRQPKPTAPTPALPGSPSCRPRTGTFEYGCYCGTLSSCGSGLTCTPANELDACCQRHDREYGSCDFADRYNPFSRCFPITRAADIRLCGCALRLTGRFHGASEAFRLGVLAVFCPRVTPISQNQQSPAAGAPGSAVAMNIPSGTAAMPV